jgi:hypothetical protein
MCAYTAERVSVTGSRRKDSTNKDTCGYVRGVPKELRDPLSMAPDGINTYYDKYTESYGIPVIGQ